MKHSSDSSAKIFYIFLDFDGVMVTKFSKQLVNTNRLDFDPVCVESLKTILLFLKNRGKLVNLIVSSNWRNDISEFEIKQMLKHHKINPLVNDIGFTDLLGNKRMEIESYIEKIGISDDSCIIFDDENLGEILEGFLIRTRYEDGIRPTKEIIELLESTIFFKKY